MNATLLRHRSNLALAVAAATALLAACDGDTLALDTQESAPTLVVGQVKAASPTGAAFASPSDLSGIEVSVSDNSVSTTTNADGSFQLEARSDDGRVRLRFRRGAMDVELEVEGLRPGGTLHVQVSLSERGASLDDVRNDDRDNDDRGNDGARNDDRGNDNAGGAEGTEFEGRLVSLSLSGETPSRTARLEVSGTSGSVVVDVVEEETTFAQDGDLLSFAALLDGAGAGRDIRVEGAGVGQSDGSLRAGSVKVEVDEDQAGNDPQAGNDDRGNDDPGNDNRGGAAQGEFEGRLVSLTTSGSAPERTARVVLAANGMQTTVDISESATAFESRGDLRSFTALLAGHAAGRPIKIEGDGARQADGTFRATSVKVEVDD